MALLMMMGWNPCVVFGSAASTQTLARSGVDEKAEFVRLEQYLRRNQLHEMLIDLYQDELQSRGDPAERTQLATQLSQLYGWMMSHQSDNFEEFSSAWDELADKFPESIESRAWAQVLFGRYRRARDDFGVWMRDGGDDARREEVHRQFSELVERANQLVEMELRLAVEHPSSNANATESADLKNKSASERQELVLGNSESGLEPNVEIPAQAGDRDGHAPLSKVAIQARYVLAWSQYYRAMTLSESALRADDLGKAATMFQELLQIPTGTELLELRPQWFALDSDWNCRLVVGLGMACQAVGQKENAAYCFELLREPKIPPTIRQYRLVYQFQSMVFAGQLVEASEFLQALETTSNRKAANTDLWTSAAMTGLGARVHENQDAAYQAIALSGMRNLVVQNDWRAIDVLLDGSSREFSGGDLFANWLEGYRSLRLAQAGHPGQIAVAVSRLSAALDQTAQLVKVATSEKQFELRARCRYHMGFALYLDQQYPASIEQFRQAVAVLNHLDRQVAEHGLWMQCQAQERMAGSDAGSSLALMESLQDFMYRYPDSERVGDALFMQTLQQIRNQQPAEAIRSLAAIPTNNANFGRARLELCRLAHQQWSQLDRSNVNFEKEHQELEQAIIDSALEITGLSQAPSTISPAQQVRACLFAADILMHKVTSDIVEADSWLSRAAQLILPDAMDAGLRSEYCYLDMAIGSSLKDKSRQQRGADWLVNNAVRPEHERAAWLVLGELGEFDLEREQATLSLDAVHERLQNVIDCYSQAVGHESDGSLMPKASTTALARIAALQHRSGQTEDAYQSYQRLVRFDGENIQWLSGLARTATELKKWPQAVELWRRIAAALPPGTNDWLESKYGVVRCLAELDRESALQVLQQTRLLAPEMPEPWASKFAQIGVRVESEIETSRSIR